eukprot:TRINITY_DN6572_c0_g1_i4.p2 TRINITY_DN6572_c0_g1~~TRINITY_DN6572_c0_g1_i4.p2  ORF type:complete len:157 (-),score=39.44 TRINITY_DN6572_c0_g1_i4:61-531(-)
MSKIFLHEGNFIKYQIWDTAGQEKYESLVPMYYKDAKVALIVYDITNQSSFEKVKFWVQELREKGPPNMILAVVGNKIDLEDKEEVSYEEANSYAKELNAIFAQTSAKENRGIEALFTKISKQLYEDPNFKPASEQRMTTADNNVKLHEDLSLIHI